MEYLPVVFMMLFYGGMLCILVYLVFKRIAAKGKEDFEKRDN